MGGRANGAQSRRRRSRRWPDARFAGDEGRPVRYGGGGTGMYGLMAGRERESARGGADWSVAPASWVCAMPAAVGIGEASEP